MSVPPQEKRPIKRDRIASLSPLLCEEVCKSSPLNDLENWVLMGEQWRSRTDIPWKASRWYQIKNKWRKGERRTIFFDVKKYFCRFSRASAWTKSTAKQPAMKWTTLKIWITQVSGRTLGSYKYVDQKSAIIYICMETIIIQWLITNLMCQNSFNVSRESGTRIIFKWRVKRSVIVIRSAESGVNENRKAIHSIERK